MMSPAPGPSVRVPHCGASQTPITYEYLLSLQESDVPHSYTERDTMLYALSIGMGRDPLNDDELQYVFEGMGTLRALPTQAITVCVPGLIWNIGLDVERFLHGEQKFKFHRPFPPAAEVFNSSRIAQVYDRGHGKGCVLELDGTVRLADGQPLVSWLARIVALGDGGIGTDRKLPRPHVIPDRKPDMIGVAETRRDQALLYRLNGDRNLVHVDPRVARGAGFPVPILHGACTASIACREIVRLVCKYDQSWIEEFDVRWTAPVFPGEHVETAMWLDDGVVSFRCRSVERDKVVIDHGRCTLRSTPAIDLAPDA